ncbi:hypothetical protein SYNPS1DRAFT_27475 [Syncephalis pseudoplumigaleata]|uniref:Uncharacterized protein n=1 Tax=Syncephalis pseudoplumigaleata TaxID=1712513 RepID=A0A4P9Z368_9FUNG|nr:hypothetical protein SYNPS1DRAFT_27475 [Syncephalis pseudoplumigaleata]|eukprot:RKP26845.1 hypothetical protein SYNPS1DRAFT_27475 [Syncephalis pseudoplumigaleata]
MVSLTRILVAATLVLAAVNLPNVAARPVDETATPRASRFSRFNPRQAVNNMKNKVTGFESPLGLRRKVSTSLKNIPSIVGRKRVTTSQAVVQSSPLVNSQVQKTPSVSSRSSSSISAKSGNTHTSQSLSSVNTNKPLPSLPKTPTSSSLDVTPPGSPKMEKASTSAVPKVEEQASTSAAPQVEKKATTPPPTINRPARFQRPRMNDDEINERHPFSNRIFTTNSRLNF